MNIARRNSEFTFFASSLMQTDETYGTYLYGAGRAADRLAKDATNAAEDIQSLAFYLDKLPFRYPFATKAEQSMDDAEREITAALARIKAARAQYANMAVKLPVKDWSGYASALKLNEKSDARAD